MLRRVPVVLALLAAPFAATPATAVPPAVVTGYGTISPAMTLLPPDPYTVWFNGTVTPAVGAAYACSFGGSGWNYVPGTLTGFVAPLSTSCGTGVDLGGCPFELTPASFKVACPAGTFVMQASYTGVEPTSSFTATGVLL